MKIALLIVPTFISFSLFASESEQATVTVKPSSLFLQADLNKDGTLDAKEFELFKQLQEARITQQIHERFQSMQFRAFDQDGNGNITQDELKAIRLMNHQKTHRNAQPSSATK